ncbi:hypothetical protein [Serratia marcescens]|uniref:hypothetical protein n=1 Tax=Serratia marcescens TaxID=615 RepID=UPI001554A6D1|nr:hypothetical protein [Serratia marcescens]UJA57007.1 hypothetical protein L1F17_22405 [Serratia marcescens]
MPYYSDKNQRKQSKIAYGEVCEQINVEDYDTAYADDDFLLAGSGAAASGEEGIYQDLFRAYQSQLPMLQEFRKLKGHNIQELLVEMGTLDSLQNMLTAISGEAEVSVTGTADALRKVIDELKSMEAHSGKQKLLMRKAISLTQLGTDAMMQAAVYLLLARGALKSDGENTPPEGEIIELVANLKATGSAITIARDEASQCEQQLADVTDTSALKAAVSDLDYQLFRVETLVKSLKEQIRPAPGFINKMEKKLTNLKQKLPTTEKQWKEAWGGIKQTPVSSLKKIRYQMWPAVAILPGRVGGGVKRTTQTGIYGLAKGISSLSDGDIKLNEQMRIAAGFLLPAISDYLTKCGAVMITSPEDAEARQARFNDWCQASQWLDKREEAFEWEIKRLTLVYEGLEKETKSIQSFEQKIKTALKTFQTAAEKLDEMVENMPLSGGISEKRQGYMARALEEARNARKELGQVIVLETGKSLNLFSTDWRIARYIGDFFNEKRVQFIQQYPEISLKTFDQTVEALIRQEVAQHFTKARSLDGEQMVIRANAAYREAREGTMLRGESTADILQDVPGMAEYLAKSGQKSLPGRLIFSGVSGNWGRLATTDFRKMGIPNLSILKVLASPVTYWKDYRRVAESVDPGNPFPWEVYRTLTLRRTLTQGLRILKFALPQAGKTGLAVGLSVWGLYKKGLGDTLKKAGEEALLGTPITGGHVGVNQLVRNTAGQITTPTLEEVITQSDEMLPAPVDGDGNVAATNEGAAGRREEEIMVRASTTPGEAADTDKNNEETAASQRSKRNRRAAEFDEHLDREFFGDSLQSQNFSPWRESPGQSQVLNQCVNDDGRLWVNAPKLRSALKFGPKFSFINKTVKITVTDNSGDKREYYFTSDKESPYSAIKDICEKINNTIPDVRVGQENNDEITPIASEYLNEFWTSKCQGISVSCEIEDSEWFSSPEPSQALTFESNDFSFMNKTVTITVTGSDNKQREYSFSSKKQSPFDAIEDICNQINENIPDVMAGKRNVDDIKPLDSKYKNRLWVRAGSQLKVTYKITSTCAPIILSRYDISDEGSYDDWYKKLCDDAKKLTYLNAINYTLEKIMQDNSLSQQTRHNAHLARIRRDVLISVDIDGLKLANIFFIPDTPGAKKGILVNLNDDKNIYTYIASSSDIPVELSASSISENKLNNNNKPMDVFSLSEHLYEVSKEKYKNEPHANHNRHVLKKAIRGSKLSNKSVPVPNAKYRLRFTWAGKSLSEYLRVIASPFATLAGQGQLVASAINNDSIRDTNEKVKKAEYIGSWVDATAGAVVSFTPAGAVLNGLQSAATIAADLAEGKTPDPLDTAGLLMSCFPGGKVAARVGKFSKTGEKLVKYLMLIGEKTIDLADLGRSIKTAIDTGEPLTIYQALLASGMSVKNAYHTAKNMSSELKLGKTMEESASLEQLETIHNSPPEPSFSSTMQARTFKVGKTEMLGRVNNGKIEISRNNGATWEQGSKAHLLAYRLQNAGGVLSLSNKIVIGVHEFKALTYSKEKLDKMKKTAAPYKLPSNGVERIEKAQQDYKTGKEMSNAPQYDDYNSLSLDQKLDLFNSQDTDAITRGVLAGKINESIKNINLYEAAKSAVSWKKSANKATKVVLAPQNIYLKGRKGECLPESVLMGWALQNGKDEKLAKRLMDIYSSSDVTGNPLYKTLVELHADGNASKFSAAAISDVKVSALGDAESRLFPTENTSVRIDLPEHTMLLSKVNQEGKLKYVFYDPNYGLAYFDSYKDMSDFFKKKLKEYDIPEDSTKLYQLDYSALAEVKIKGRGFNEIIKDVVE